MKILVSSYVILTPTTLSTDTCIFSANINWAQFKISVSVFSENWPLKHEHIINITTHILVFDWPYRTQYNLNEHVRIGKTNVTTKTCWSEYGHLFFKCHKTKIIYTALYKYIQCYIIRYYISGREQSLERSLKYSYCS